MWSWANRFGTIRSVGQGVAEGQLVATRRILLCIFGSHVPSTGHPHHSHGLSLAHIMPTWRERPREAEPRGGWSHRHS